jgi:2-C-methyl-D-erythritol 4-phosphate cytidylyltransferase
LPVVSHRHDIDAIILAAGRGERLGLGPKAWLTLGGRTLLERAIETVRGLPVRVFVGIAHEDMARARPSCDPDTVLVPGGATHRETMLAALQVGDAPLVLVHDVAHPFVTSALAQEVLAAAHVWGAAVAAVRATSSAYHRVGDQSVSRFGAGEIWTVRRPFAFRRADFARGLAQSSAHEGLSVILARAGIRTELVPTPAWNIKITAADDWAMAQAIEEGLHPTAPR